MLPIGAIGIYFIGAGVTTVNYDVLSSRNWLLATLMAYIVNYAIAWFLKHSFGWTAVRMLISSIFAYLSISEIVDLMGENFDNIGQIMGGSGSLTGEAIKEIRFITVAWIFSLVLMITAIAVGFEPDDLQEDNGKNNDF